MQPSTLLLLLTSLVATTLTVSASPTNMLTPRSVSDECTNIKRDCEAVSPSPAPTPTPIPSTPLHLPLLLLPTLSPIP
jgi:hypothetical protein